MYNMENNSVQFIENKHKNSNGGAGTRAGETVAELNAERVISGDFGPKTKALLEKLNIQMVILDEPHQTVGGILGKITKNEK